MTMNRERLPLFRLCRRCLQNTRATSTSTKTIPLRIFETSEETDYRQTTKFPKQNWKEEMLAKASSAERFKLNLQERLGQKLQRGLRRKIEFDPSLTIIHKPQYKPPREIFPTTKVSPEELLQQKGEVEESPHQMFRTIENCIAAAVDRLELYAPEQKQMEKSLRPRVGLPHAQFMWLCNILRFQFSSEQIVDYGSRYGLTKSRLVKANRSGSIAMILDKIWNLEIENEVLTQEAVVTKSLEHSFSANYRYPCFPY
jgi:hypothetical protein